MNAKVTFSISPWLLFAIVPVVAAVFIMFLIGKRRGSRITINRVIAAVLQCAAALCCVFSLAGIRAEYDEPNVPRELVILVDGSATASGQREQMNDFVRDVLETNNGRCRVAVAVFGRGQRVALEMGDRDAEEAYDKYLVSSAVPDESATDIAAALRLAYDPLGGKSLISDPTRAKILILGDGLETDGDAIGAMKTLTREGVQIETSFFAGDRVSDSSILGVDYPTQSIFPDKEIELKLTVRSSFAANTVVTYTDRDEAGNETTGSVRVDIEAGTQELTIKYRFVGAGFHEVKFDLDKAIDGTEENNVFCSYLDVTERKKVLMIETYDGESALLAATIGDPDKSDIVVETKALRDTGAMTADELSAYSEVILYNSAQKQMTSEFQAALFKYVNEAGGGLFTVGGFEKSTGGDIVMQPKYHDPSSEVPVRHSYVEDDIKGSVLESMLPVTIEEYKPAVAVVFVFDISGSMTGTGGPLFTALNEAENVIEEVLDSRDFAGIVTLRDSYAQLDPLRPVTQKEDLIDTLDSLMYYSDPMASTRYAPALRQATSMLLQAPPNVARKHIVLLSDGGPGDDLSEYGPAVQEAAEQGITTTVVTYYLKTRVIDGETYYFNHANDTKGQEIKVGNMQRLAELGNGTLRLIPRTANPGWTQAMTDDMRLEELGDLGYESYNPEIGDHASEILGDITRLQLDGFTLGGYFPSRQKLDGSVVVPLLAEGSPLYAQWDLGAGKVGSILIDLEGVWSNELFEDDIGRGLLRNITSSLMRAVTPVEKPIVDVTLSENNFSTQVNIFGYEKGKEDAKLVAFVLSPDEADPPQKFDLDELSLGGNRFTFENPKVGVYTVQVLKVKADLDFADDSIVNIADIPKSEIIGSVELHRAFSYSKEYDRTADPFTTGQDLLAALSTREAKDGVAYSKFVYDAETVFAENGIAHRIVDFRLGLLIAALVLYFAGIVIRRVRLRRRRK